jgi:hypothetical protein
VHLLILLLNLKVESIASISSHFFRHNGWSFLIISLLAFLLSYIDETLFWPYGWSFLNLVQNISRSVIMNLRDYDLIWFIVFNATFSNIPAISWRPVLVVEEAGVPRENHRSWASNW